MSRTPIVAYQGMAGAYSHLACSNALPDHEPLPCHSFEDMLTAVQEGEADKAMVPVENSVAGRVADIHHLLPESGLFIVGEYFQRVNHMLLGVPGATIEDLREVRAHPQSLAQCRKLIGRLKLKRINHADNAGAAHEVAALGDRGVAAIASTMAARVYGLDVDGLSQALVPLAAHSLVVPVSVRLRVLSLASLVSLHLNSRFL